MARAHDKAIQEVEEAIADFKSVGTRLQSAQKRLDENIRADQAEIAAAQARIDRQQLARTQATTLRANLEAMLSGKLKIEDPTDQV